MFFRKPASLDVSNSHPGTKDVNEFGGGCIDTVIFADREEAEKAPTR